MDGIEESTTGGHLGIANGTFRHDHSGLRRCEVEGQERMLSEMVGGEEKLSCVRRPGHLGHRTISVGSVAHSHYELAFGG